MFTYFELFNGTYLQLCSFATIYLWGADQRAKIFQFEEFLGCHPSWDPSHPIVKITCKGLSCMEVEAYKIYSSKSPKTHKLTTRIPCGVVVAHSLNNLNHPILESRQLNLNFYFVLFPEDFFFWYKGKQKTTHQAAHNQNTTIGSLYKLSI